jgi:zeaxanthin glucosyltransferase
MARILTLCHGLPSVVFQGVELARRLAAHGHVVTWAGPRASEELAVRHGLAFRPLASGRLSEWLDRDSTRPVLIRLRTLRARRASALASLELDGFERLLHEERPHLLLVNGEMHEHILTALPTGIPVALLNTFVSIWRQPGLPPPHTMARPGIGWQGSRLGTWLLWTALAGRKRARSWWGRARHLGCDRLSLLGDLARRGGLDLAREADGSQWLIPFTYRRLPVLSLHAVEFDFPHAPPAHVRYVGPMVLGDRLDTADDGAGRGRLDAILARRRAGGATQTLIYAGFGSAFSTDLAFLRRLFACVVDRPGWELVVSLGRGALPPDLGPLPERVHVFPWVPQLSVLAAADVVVTHGGVNTIDECVLNGVPTLVYCGWETDMGGTTARVVYHGIGLAGDRRRDSTDDIRRLVDRLIDEPGFRQRMDVLRARYEAYASGRVAEREVDAILVAARGHRAPRDGASPSPQVRA